MTNIIFYRLLRKVGVISQQVNTLCCFLLVLALSTIVGIAAPVPANAKRFINRDGKTLSTLSNTLVEGLEGAGLQRSLKTLGYVGRQAPEIEMSSHKAPFLSDARLGSLNIVPMLWPVLGRITSHFGERRDPFSGKNAFHAGLDIASRYGDAVRAAASGIIAETDRRGGYGRLIVIDHGLGITTWYGHLSRFAIKAGAHVECGNIIGYEGQSGRSTGAHLHYEMRINNEPVNPWRYLRNMPTAFDTTGN